MYKSSKTISLRCLKDSLLTQWDHGTKTIYILYLENLIHMQLKVEGLKSHE